ncbi:MAG: hypothetical protein U0169_17700 [Polyangiaceae bacterium]
MQTALRALRFAFFLVSMAAFVPALSGCGKKAMWRTFPAQGELVSISPMQAYVQGKRLYVRVTVVNRSNEPVTIIRDAVRVVLPDARVIGRSTGSSSTHNPYYVPSGGAQQVYVDFMAEGFNWNEVGLANVDFSQAILVRGAMINVEPVRVER